MSEFNIPAEAKEQILAQRIEQLNLEGYQHELLLKQFEAVGATDSTEAQTSRDAIEVIKKALDVLTAELEII